MPRIAKTDAETFIKTWQKAESLADAAKKAGCSEVAARQRATHYRAKGIPMKYFPHTGGGAALDIAELAKVAKNNMPKDAQMTRSRTTTAAKTVKKTAKKSTKKTVGKTAERRAKIAERAAETTTAAAA